MELKNVKQGKEYKVNKNNPGGHFFNIGDTVTVIKIKEKTIHAKTKTGFNHNLAAYHLDEI